MQRGFLLSFLIFSFSIQSFCQTKTIGWQSNDVFQTRYFIENKGQFVSESDSVLFGIDNVFDHINFLKAGFEWKLEFNETFIDSDKFDTGSNDEEFDNDLRITHTETCHLKMLWLNSNPNAEVIATEKSKHYFSYGDESTLSSGYKVITYHNLYQGIDVQYSIPEAGGVEYIITLNPGADLSEIKFSYEADEPIHISTDGKSLLVNNDVIPLSEKNLKAFDSNGNPVNLNYVIHGNEISFETENYNPLLGLTIDPWITSASSLVGIGTYDGTATDVDYDLAGDLFVFGGGGSTNLPNLPKVSKYDGNGNLLWTFNGSVSSIPWSTSNSAAQLGNFVVDKSSGKTYISQGYTNGGNRVVRLNSAGVYDNFVSVANTGFQEIWEMKFNCVTGDLLGMGGGTNTALNFGVIDTTTASVNTLNVTGITSTYFQDILNCAINDNGQPFIIFASGATTFVDDRIYKLNNNYTTSIWNQASGFNVFDEANNKSYINNSYPGNGFNCLAVNINYLFYYDGQNLKAFDSNTGASVGNPLIIPGNFPKLQGGIYANSCNEVFIGGNNGHVLKYFFDGTNFNVLPSLPLAVSPTARIYDINYNPLNSLLYVSGQGFVATVDPVTLCVDSVSSIQLQLNTVCPDSMWVQIINPNVTSSYSFIWRNQAGTILSNVVAPAGVSVNGLGGLSGGIPYTVQVLQTSACQVVSSTLNFTISCVGQYIHLCPGQTFTLPGGTVVNTAGIYNDTILSSVPGVDSIIVTNLQYYAVDSSTNHVTICSGQPYTLPGGQQVNFSGTYTDTLTNMHGCDSIITTILNIIPLFSNNSVSVCIGQGYTLPGGTTVYVDGLYVDTLLNSLGCDSVIKTHVTFYQITGSQSVNLCNGDSFTLPGGTVVSVGGLYYDTIPSPLGCDSAITTTITIVNQTSSTQDTLICEGTSILLPDGQTASNAGTYNSIIPNAVGCDSTITTHLQTVAAPLVSIGNDTMLCSGTSIVLTANNYPATYLWNNGSKDSSIVVTTPSVYSVAVTLPPCAAVMDSVVISFRECSCLIMPNAFSPNNDGDNDAVKPLSDCNFDLNPYLYRIYNRWGQLIFETTDLSERWDGTYQDKDAEVGVYIYTISFFNPIIQQTVFLKGNLTLLR